MKKKMFITAVLILSVSLTTQVIAQEVMQSQKATAKPATPATATATMVNEKPTTVCTGKVRCTDGTCTIDFEQEIVSPRDASSGLPTGKRMHKPFTITKELDKSSPELARESPTKGTTGAVRESPTKSSAGKVTVNDISITVYVKGKSRILPVVNGQFTMPTDGQDKDCDLIVSWSWGATNSGSNSPGTTGSGISKYQATFNLEMVGGEYMASKHTKTGHVTLMK